MRRRQLLSLGRWRERSVSVSCEALYMRLLDARQAGEPARPLTALARRLRGAERLVLQESGWLADRQLAEALRPLLDSFAAGDGRVELA